MIPKSKVWYSAPQARDCPAISCYSLVLHDIERGIYNGYYYDGKFYIGEEDRTGYITAWKISQKEEEVSLN